MGDAVLLIFSQGAATTQHHIHAPLCTHTRAFSLTSCEMKYQFLFQQSSFWKVKKKKKSWGDYLKLIPFCKFSVCYSKDWNKCMAFMLPHDKAESWYGYNVYYSCESMTQEYFAYTYANPSLFTTRLQTRNLCQDVTHTNLKKLHRCKSSHLKLKLSRQCFDIILKMQQPLV